MLAVGPSTDGLPGTYVGTPTSHGRGGQTASFNSSQFAGGKRHWCGL